MSVFVGATSRTASLLWGLLLWDFVGSAGTSDVCERRLTAGVIDDCAGSDEATNVSDIKIPVRIQLIRRASCRPYDILHSSD